ncbi:MAG: tetratricopeptide repeat protein [Pseudomonadota bacterium]
MSFFEELKRRNVIRVAIAYVVTAWLLIQVAETIFPLFGFDDTPARITVIVLVVGFIPALIVAWVLEFTPDGIKFDSEVDHSAASQVKSGKRFDRVVIVLLAVAVTYFAVDKLIFSETRELQIAEEAREQGFADAQQDIIDNRSVAVLPFVNLSAGEDNEYLSDGITEEILNSLSRLPGLRVPGRTSSFAFRGSTESIQTIGEMLSVGTILEGSVRRSGDKIRVTAKLIKVADGYQLWSENYDQEMTDIFEIQDNIARNIVDKLRITLVDTEIRTSPSRRASDWKAYDLFLNGKYHAQRFSKNDLEEAIVYFEQALELEPDYARAYAGLAYAYGSLRYFGHVPPDTVTEEFRFSVKRALELDDDLGDAHFSNGQLLYNTEWDFAGAEAAFERAIELDPSNSWIRGLYAFLLATTGRLDAAMQQAEQAEFLDDRSAAAIAQLGWMALYAGDNEAALDAADRALAFGPNFVNAYELRGHAHFRAGRLAAGIAAMEEAVRISDFPIVLGTLGRMYGDTARTENAQAILNQLLERSEREYVPSAVIANVYVGLDEFEEANNWMQKAIADREGILVLLKVGGYPSDAENPYFPNWLDAIGLADF